MHARTQGLSFLEAFRVLNEGQITGCGWGCGGDRLVLHCVYSVGAELCCASFQVVVRFKDVQFGGISIQRDCG